MAVGSENTVVPCRFSGQLHTASFKDLQLPEPTLDIGGGRIAVNALQHLAQDDVGQAQTLTIELVVEPVSFRVPYAAEIVHTHRSVDDHHARLLRGATEARSLEITVPYHLPA